MRQYTYAPMRLAVITSARHRRSVTPLVLCGFWPGGVRL